MLIVLLLILRKFLVVAGNTDKTIRCPSYNCKGWKPDAVDVYSGVCGTCGYTEEVSACMVVAGNTDKTDTLA